MTRWTTDPVLSVEHLTMRFGGLVAVRGLSFTAGRGDITAIIGPNGAGKTTVFNCLTGFYKPTEGRIAMLHDPSGASAVDTVTAGASASKPRVPVYLLERMADQEIARRARVARTFQNIRLFSGMTVLENLMVAQHNALMQASGFTLLGIVGLGFGLRDRNAGEGAAGPFGLYGAAERAAVDRARYWLDRIGLLRRADDPAGDLPYGDQRRLEIARAMCSEPLLLCLDEPAAGLNPRESGALNDLLQYIRADHAVSLLLIEHDMSVVMGISDHIVVLDYGEKISDGVPAMVRNDPKVIAAYLGVEDEEVEAVAAEVSA